MSKILEVKNLHVAYGPIEALKGISINVEHGQIVALLGANGAGKTTTLNTISGVVKSKSGEVIFYDDEKEENIVNLRPDKVANRGIMQSPEGRKIFTDLTVEDNLNAGAYAVKDKNQVRVNFERVYKLFPILESRKKQQAGTLSGGELQMLAIGRALMGSPKLLVLDEPSLGLAPLVIKDIFNTLVQIKNEGTTILIVEQNAKQTLKIADYAYVLELGRISMEGTGEELLNNKSLIEAYLGGK
jgi:branched-chain amino acid transport system ATP-binding protein